jgi:hypothetical protein
MEKALLQKFRIKSTSTVVVVNGPTEFSFQQSGQGDRVVLVFVRSQQDVTKFALKFAAAAKEEKLVLWCAFPKKSAGIKTDINRDSGWDELTRLGLEIVSILSMDETWSACRFKNKPENSTRAITTKSDKALFLPERLQNLLNENLASKKFFESLSYTNRKEYALWISTAKRPETIENRLTAIKTKLSLGKKNPSEK